MSTNVKLSKARLSKIIQFGRFFGTLLGKLGDTIIKPVVPLAKNALLPTAVASAADAGIQKKNMWKGRVKQE